MSRRSPPPGLHHRLTPQPQLSPQSTFVPVSPSKAYYLPTRLVRRTHRLKDRVRYVVFKLLVPFGVVFGLITYLLALSHKEWPPAGETLTSNGLINQFQGEWWVSPNLTRAERFLLVVAHPDDECLFFSPTLLSLLQPRYVNLTELGPDFVSNSTHNSTKEAYLSESLSHPSPPGFVNSTLLKRPIGHILSLSSGNADGLGMKRTREMRASCWAFGIPSDKCIVLDHPELQDSMSVWWPEKKISEFVKLYVDLWQIDLLITFDHHGVSGHANHRAIAAAITRLVHSDRTFPMTMMLESSSLLSKYTSLFSLPLSLYHHHHARKFILPSLARPTLHPSRDRQRLAQLVLNTLSYLNLSTDTHPDPSSTHLANLSTGINQTDLLRPTDSNRSTHHSLFLSTPGQYVDGRRAFNQHVTQNAWFRRLWLVFSRYMWINELRRVVPLEDRFEVDHPVPPSKSLSDSSE
ncbi:hypothetical protein CROQUDRAFT_88119 [Cronartium quercuum f. sp. fusiforme G11]|uniref:N-acetylglucosaminylphosphatidylinositol deacetylase n=1 Tax=Cronartium quercuum f. sp. fusiforme G11 TaxID=708437 RepID=A0A9P6TFU4_9BASI|nr:hypothetical protein CROQUDRAFT_88119 [Cronartium quercuum f. sp. fusiforme G11]